jgi:hypothetical protein
MKQIKLIAVLLLAGITTNAQIRNPKTETAKVYGNCEMCESKIEKTGSAKNTAKVSWSAETKMATITYNSKKTSKSVILKRIAQAGYDNEMFLAPDAAYAKLPGCCKYERSLKVMAKVNTDAKKDTQPVKGTNQLQTVYNSYFDLKDALVKTDAATASANAASLLTALNAVKMETLKMEEHLAWMKLEKELKTDAAYISKSRDITRQRSHFITLSKNMTELVKAAKPAEKVYLQHCPMANDGKGADWLSRENPVKNPYYGSMMLTCGKTVETIQ